MTASDPIFNQIFRGDFDSELDGIVEAVRLRRDYLGHHPHADRGEDVFVVEEYDGAQLVERRVIKAESWNETDVEV